MREKILEATIKVFNKKGLKFTMDDVARELSMSKKTIYTVFRDKESLFLHMVDYCFDKIKESEEAVLDDQSLSTTEKIKKILGVMPESYKDVDFRQLYSLKEKYPKTYQRVQERLENGWENTIALLNQGIEEKVVRPVNVMIVKMMFESAIEQFFSGDILIRNKMTYNEALEEVVNVIADGIIVRGEQK